MKKKLLGGIAVAAIAFAVAFNLSVKQDSNKLSALALDNVEALAGESTSVDIPCKKYAGKTCEFDCNLGGTLKTCMIEDYIKI